MSRLAAVRARVEGPRVLALLAALALIGAFTSVLYGLVDVAGGTREFDLLFAASLLGATALARLVRPTRAAVVVLGLFVAGLGWYLLSLPYVPAAVPILESNLEILSGQSVHEIRQSAIWALAVVPAPVFATWYFALRRRYGAALLVGGAMLAYLVLSGDATVPVTLVGVVGGTALLGFGDLDRHGGSTAGAEYVALTLAIMVALPLVVTVVPGGAATPLSLAGGGGTPTQEASLLETDAELPIAGSLSLSPDVRFTVEADRGRYWKADSFDRYTGDGWIRTGGTSPLTTRPLPYPPGPRRTVAQRIEVETTLSSMPAAWRPVGVGPATRNRTAVTDLGDITATEPLVAGETYRVVSAVPATGPALLADADQAYPPTVRDRYTRLPSSTSPRVAERTAEITANATTAYATALTIERWLEANREYSLEVDRPSGDVAEAFLFEMDRGYCTYYATTMAVMLRTQGVPARVVTGYTTGQQVAENRWVVRGLEAHAWVEVYFADVGWVGFDPTPSAPREGAEQERIATARENNETGVDTDESRGVTETPPRPSNVTGAADPTGPATTPRPPNASEALGVPDSGIQGAPPTQPTATGPTLPPREHVVLGAIVLVGVAAGIRRTGLARWLRRTARVAWQRRVDPATDVERAFERALIILERRHRPRRRGETVRDYLAAVDAPEPARRLARIRERATYGERVDAAAADEAVALVGALRDRGERRLGRPRLPNP